MKLARYRSSKIDNEMEDELFSKQVFKNNAKLYRHLTRFVW